jgi:hypothetical protein
MNWSRVTAKRPELIVFTVWAHADSSKRVQLRNPGFNQRKFSRDGQSSLSTQLAHAGFLA